MVNVLEGHHKLIDELGILLFHFIFILFYFRFTFLLSFTFLFKQCALLLVLFFDLPWASDSQKPVYFWLWRLKNTFALIYYLLLEGQWPIDNIVLFLHFRTLRHYFLCLFLLLLAMFYALSRLLYCLGKFFFLFIVVTLSELSALLLWVSLHDRFSALLFVAEYILK